ncbi:hypothetical protein Pfo_014004 [Paulownia fortunei]|nr:hypothetical protein Pfo_014004 [Paulownia fortunei]
MSDAKEVKFSLKVMINKQKTKVLFAEADSDFTDVLLSFLTLPLGTIVRVLEKRYGQAPVVGSLTTLYNGLANLNSVYFWTEGAKQMLLNPRSSLRAECRKLKLDMNDSQPTNYFTCDCSYRFLQSSIYYDAARCCCGQQMKTKLGIEEPQAAADGDSGVFTMNEASFIISDDLQIFPNMTGFMQTLSNLGISDSDGGELRNVTFGFSEIMDLLKGSLLSRTPLSDFVLSERQMDSATVKSEPGILLHQIDNEATSNSEKMILKVIVQKSTNKLLFAQAEKDFIDFLFSLLTIPLAGVECLLGCSTSLKNIDNLYRSITNINGDKYLKTQDTKNILLKPNVYHGYISKNYLLPLSEECVSPSFHRIGWGTALLSSVKFPKGQGNYVKGPTIYKVTDDLTVTPFCMASSLCILSGLKIHLSDVKELELHIGLEEALSILKASLTSTSALTSGLLNPILQKQPKQEH